MVSGTDFIKNKRGRMSDPSADLQIALQLPTQIVPAEWLLTAAEFRRLADDPPEFEWFANIRNVHTRHAVSGGQMLFHLISRLYERTYSACHDRTSDDPGRIACGPSRYPAKSPCAPMPVSWCQT